MAAFESLYFYYTTNTEWVLGAYFMISFCKYKETHVKLKCV